MPWQPCLLQAGPPGEFQPWAIPHEILLARSAILRHYPTGELNHLTDIGETYGLIAFDLSPCCNVTVQRSVFSRKSVRSWYAKGTQRYAKVRKGTQKVLCIMSATLSKLPRKQIKTLSQEVAPTPIRALRQPRKGTQQERKYHALVRSYIFDWRKATEGRGAENGIAHADYLNMVILYGSPPSMDASTSTRNRGPQSQ